MTFTLFFWTTFGSLTSCDFTNSCLSSHLVDAIFLNTVFPAEPLCSVFLGGVLLDLCHIVVPQSRLCSRDTLMNRFSLQHTVYMSSEYRVAHCSYSSTLSIRSFSTPNFPPYPYDALGTCSFCFTCSCSEATLLLSSATLAGHTDVKHTHSDHQKV